jgi:hypothetical protein
VNGDKWQRAPGVVERIAELKAENLAKSTLRREELLHWLYNVAKKQ